ncbi:hypothetical protein QVD17_30519 [Tagetes erecta]|uniref:Uncharacterized protein n=1 Tax=Tagetes erecta TaxID=13708 RepID=A0AAD8K2V2_TARER|nr:hypothetical protein QVD17_30519 [Tagetes erecta]
MKDKPPCSRVSLHFNRLLESLLKIHFRRFHVDLLVSHMAFSSSITHSSHLWSISNSNATINTVITRCAESVFVYDDEDDGQEKFTSLVALHRLRVSFDGYSFAFNEHKLGFQKTKHQPLNFKHPFESV